MHFVLSNYFVGIFSFLISLLPAFFILGPAVPDLTITIISLFFLFFFLKKKNFTIFHSYILLYLFIIFIYLNLNSFFSYQVSTSFKYSLGFLRVIVFAVSLCFLIEKNINIIKNFSNCFFVCIVLLFFDSLFQFFTGTNIFGHKPQDPARITSFFGEEQIMGSYIARLLPLIISLFYLQKKKQFYAFILIMLSGILIFLSGERISFAYFLIFLFFYFFIELNIKKIFLVLFSFFLIFSVLTSKTSSQLDRLVKHTLDQAKTSSFFVYSYRHQLHYLSGLSMFRDKPIIGQGLGTFRFLCSKREFSQFNKIVEDGKFFSKKSGYYFIKENYDSKDNVNFYSILIKDKNDFKVIINHRIKPNHIFYFKSGDYVKEKQLLYSDFEFINGCNTHPHNIYIQFLAEIGIIGFVLFSMIFIYVIYRMLQIVKLFLIQKKINYLQKAKFFIILSIFSSMFPFLPSGNYFGNWLLLITYLPFGFYLYIKKINDI